MVGIIWSNTQEKAMSEQSRATHSLSQASSTRSPGSPVVLWYLWRRSWEHPEWCRMTLFYGGLVYTGGVLRKHIHTHIQLRTQQACRLRQEWGPHSWTGNVGHTHAEHTVCYLQGQHAPQHSRRCGAVPCRLLAATAQHFSAQTTAGIQQNVWIKSSTGQSKDRGCWCLNYRDSIHLSYIQVKLKSATKKKTDIQSVLKSNSNIIIF